MDFLVLMPSSGRDFQQDEVERALTRIPGTYAHRPAGDVASTYECRFDSADDSTIVRLAADRKAIVISGVGDASIEIALRLQGLFAEPLLAVDSDYSFEIDLSGIKSVEELRTLASGADADD